MGEIIARAGEEGLKVHNFRAEGRREPRVDDEAAWAAANPGLGVIIDAATFRAQAGGSSRRRLIAPYFIAHHLNRIVSRRRSRCLRGRNGKRRRSGRIRSASRHACVGLDRESKP